MGSMELTPEERRWLSGLAEFDEGNALAFLAICAGFRIPRSYFDVGCGTGAMVKTARKLDVDAWGVDILPHDYPFLLQQDLRTFCDLGKTFDLVTSIEVAEHIEPEYADIYADTLARHLRIDGGLLVLTAAPPGQIGDGHVNCQPPIYWKDKMEARGLKYDAWATRRLVTMWEQTHWVSHWCEANLQVFHRFEVVR